MTKADGSFQKNHYDAEGLRAEMEENGQLVKFLYNEDREAVAEEESDGNVIRYIRGLGLISSDSEKAKTYYHYVSDEQGSITHVINGEEKESGELPQEDVQSRVLNHYESDAFGNTIRCDEQVHNRFHYTGEQYDPLTGQYSLRARYYNPVIAGFTQEERDKFTELLGAGFVDSFRYLNPELAGAYTWWSYRFKAREKDAGWRIDYFVVSERWKEKIEDAIIYKTVMGSDHCPIGLQMK